MNWLAKYGAPVLVILFFISCRTKDGQISVGTNYSTIGTNYTDSLSLKTYTVLVDDSVATSTRITLDGQATIYSNYFQLGKFNDPVTGTVETEIYTQLRLATENADLSGVTSVADIDSAFLYLDYAGYSYGDTNVTQQIDVFEMTSALDPAIAYFGASTPPSIDPTAIGSTPFTPTPRTRVSNLTILKIPMNFNWAYGILAAGGTTSDNFVATVLDGIAIKSTGPVGAVTRIYLGSGNTKLVIYYGEGSSYTLTMTINGQGYTRIVSDRSSTAYSGLATKVSTPSSATGEVTYMQAGVGVRTKVEIPYLSLFKEATGDNIVINKAQLVIPVPNGSTATFTPSSSISLIRTNASNTFTKNASGGIAYIQSLNQPQNGSGHDLVVYYDSTNKQFQADITDYVRDMLNQRLPNTGFFLYPNANAVSVNRTLVHSSSTMWTDRMKINLYYTIKP